MAVTHTPIFVQTPKVGKAAIAAANTARDGSGTIVTAFTAGANGAYIKRVTFRSSQATAAALSASMIGRVWISTDAGTSWTLVEERAITTATASNSVAGAVTVISFPDGLQIDASAVIGVTQSIYAGAQDRMAVVVEGADY